MQSMRENSNLSVEGTSFLLVYEDEPTDKQKKILRELYPQTSFMPRSELGDLVAHTGQDRLTMHLALKKILLFGLPLDENICFVDSDIICINSLEGLDDIGGFSAVLEIDQQKKSTVVQGRAMFNTGLFIFRPSAARWKELIEYYNTSKYEFNTLGDQLVINHFFYEKYPNEVKALPNEWNVLKRRYLWGSEWFDEKKIKLLHYVGIKPWEIDRYNEQFEWRYRTLNQLWWQYFKRTPEYEYCCQRYHLKEPDWNRLEKLSRYYELRHGLRQFCKMGKNKLRRLLGKTAE